MNAAKLVLLLGDHLDPHSAALSELDPASDLCVFIEARSEAEQVWSHKARIVLFLSAMRHFAAALRERGLPVLYVTLPESCGESLVERLEQILLRQRPTELRCAQPGTWALREAIRALCTRLGIDYRECEDHRFLFPLAVFTDWAQGRRQYRMEHWYRFLRQRSGILMQGDEPRGGRWNYDSDNRRSFGRAGPGWIPEPCSFPPDAITQEVMAMVEREFPEHPGSLHRFDWPVTAAQAEEALNDFLRHRLPSFGHFQDATWPGEVWLYHSRLSAAMNLGLLDPRRAIDGAIAELDAGRASLAAVEGFVRQILGWREYVRGIYWREMPHYLERNALGAEQPLPAWYWTGEIEMACLRDVLQRTLETGYAHHIERLMVTGLFALLLGVRPQAIHEWFLAIYVDAVEWVELPNVLGMSQYADGGMLASKPYVASGQYLQRMGGHCQRCPYRPEQATGADACPFTTLYWDFLQRHQETFSKHPRTALQWRNLERKSPAELAAIRAQAADLRERYTIV
ncbi:cryptochrome/photolyase family protein [Acidithiobacillus sp. AMEEHan]|uniref:cryptochrome/photolyase family protein n=1 Tax=Acidithiobacillus sp. AMEEHan TaxID=2994951 RepID=UPI0027E4B13E|nr:cryptochrome/photolyase family protein [Acidithiobacillus sp. AMEEHan]